MQAFIVGERFATRRVIKPEEHCGSCGGRWEDHGGYKAYSGPPTDHFFPSRFAIGKTFCVQAKRTGGALCGWKDNETGFICEREEKLHGKEAEPCAGFKRAEFKIIGGEWHRDWAARQKAEDDMSPWLQDARLEGFLHLKTWLAWYPSHKIDINKTWRILAERVI